MAIGDTASPWHLSLNPRDHMVHRWPGGRFEAASRRQTAAVEGAIRSDSHLIMVTLKGGALRHTFEADGGLRYSGRDGVGTVSFLPAGCERRLVLEDVAWEWGAIALDNGAAAGHLDGVAPFIAPSEPFLFGLVSQMQALLSEDGTLDATYCSTMSLALTEFLTRRAGAPDRSEKGPRQLSPWQLRATLERIEHLLGEPIRIAELATPLDLSEGHFHRAFRGSTGRTPLGLISERRIARAAGLLADTDKPIGDIAFDVGLASPSHMARLFRATFGCSPTAYRRQFRSLKGE